MKELRIQEKGCPIRAFFAFDPERKAIILCAGDKSNDKTFTCASFELRRRNIENIFLRYYVRRSQIMITLDEYLASKRSGIPQRSG